MTHISVMDYQKRKKERKIDGNDYGYTKTHIKKEHTTYEDINDAYKCNGLSKKKEREKNRWK